MTVFELSQALRAKCLAADAPYIAEKRVRREIVCLSLRLVDGTLPHCDRRSYHNCRWSARKIGPPAGSESVVADASRGRVRNSLLRGLENLVELLLHCANPALKCRTRSGRT